MNWWSEGGPLRRLAPVLALVVLAHAALLTQLRLAPGAGSPGQVAGSMRLLYARAVVPDPVPVAPPAQASPAPAAQAQAPVSAPDPQAPAPVSPTPPPQSAAAQLPQATPEPPYRKRSELTQPPQALAPIVVPFPAEITGVVDLRVEVTVFVDEQGVVRRIRVDTPDVEPPFARAIRDVFFSHRFAPGEVDGQAVRSQIRLEIEFNASTDRRS